MLKKSITSGVVALSAIVSLIGCSNESSPVSVSENRTETVGALADVALWSIAAAGSSVWGMSKERPAGMDANWCLYKFNTGSQMWSKTSHFGTNIATTPSGRCYHSNNGINSNVHQIWWGTLSANGQIPLPAGMITVTDIAAGQVGTEDYVWGIFGNYTGIYYVYVYKAVNGVQQWVEMTKDLNSTGSYPHRIAVDPYNGRQVLLKKNNWSCYILTSETGNWTLQSTPYRTIDVATRGTKNAYLTESAKVYKGTVNGSYNGSPLASNAIETITMDATFLYYIGTDYKARKIFH